MQDTVDQAYGAVPHTLANVIEDAPGCRAGSSGGTRDGISRSAGITARSAGHLVSARTLAHVAAIPVTRSRPAI
jgi:hypothetical protein